MPTNSKRQKKAKLRLRKWRAARKRDLGGLSYESTRNERTVTRDNRGKKRRWTLEEDAAVMASEGFTDYEVALSLGRTEFAVRARRSKLTTQTKPA